MAHESAVIGRAASRLRQAIVAQKDQLQKLHSAEPSRTGKGRQHKSHQAKLDSLQRALKKNQDEVEHLDRLILSNKRFLPTEEPSGIISPSPARGPSPGDSLDALLAEDTPMTPSELAPSQPAEVEGSPHPTVSQQPALSSQQSPRTLLSTESDTAYVTGLGYDGTSSPSSPASFDGSAVLQAGELPSSGVT